MRLRNQNDLELTLDKYTSMNLDAAVAHLRNGLCVGMPTETVYGLAADIFNEGAIDQIFKIKERPFFDPLIVHVADESQLPQVVANVPPLAQKIMKKFWPGPLTIVLPKHPDLNPKITSGLNTVGVRQPRHGLALNLIKTLGHPLAAPSANKFGRTSPTTAAHVIEEFNGLIPVLDGGPCEVGIESTVIGFNESFSEIYIFRPGAITLEQLMEFAQTTQKESPAAPGHLKHHYMPKLPLIVLSTRTGFDEFTYMELCTTLNREALHPSIMSLSEDPTLAARELYSRMRQAVESNDHVDCIVVAYDLNKKSSGLWASLSDRLQKAATVVI